MGRRKKAPGKPAPQKQQPAPPPPKAKDAGLIRIDPQALLTQAIEQNAGIETLERLVALAKDVRGEQAREAWHQAMAEFQRNCPAILKSETADIRSKRTGTTFSYSYAPLEGIMKTILPEMGPLGLSVSYRTRFDKGTVFATCRISHDLGHFEETGEVAMPVPQDESGATGPQRVGIAMTYAKRTALLCGIGLAPEDDDDAASLNGSTVSTPRRASEKKKPGGKVVDVKATVSDTTEPEQAVNTWVGQVAKVSSRKGGTEERPWEMFTVKAKDGTEFITFDTNYAQFARAAGESPVEIKWELTKRQNKGIVSIDPATDQGNLGL